MALGCLAGGLSGVVCGINSAMAWFESSAWPSLPAARSVDTPTNFFIWNNPPSTLAIALALPSFIFRGGQHFFRVWALPASAWGSHVT
eukprot:2634272-Amphidinium_carterae.1